MRHFTDYVGRRNSHELLSARGKRRHDLVPPNSETDHLYVIPIDSTSPTRGVPLYTETDAFMLKAKCANTQRRYAQLRKRAFSQLFVQDGLVPNPRIMKRVLVSKDTA
jgi:hypothetical protein